MTSLDERFRKSGRAGAVLGVFFGGLLGLGVSVGNTTWEISLGMWDGVVGTCTSTLGVDCVWPLVRERVLNLVLNEQSRIERPLSLVARNVSGSSRGFGHEEIGILPFLLPSVRASPGSSSYISCDVAGRPIVERGFCIRDCVAMADCGLFNCVDGGRVPTLLE